MEREGPLIAWPLCWMPGAGLTEEEAMIATKHRLPGERLSQGEREAMEAARRRGGHHDDANARPQHSYRMGEDLSDVELPRVDLEGADLIGVDLRGANLRGANLRGADAAGS